MASECGHGPLGDRVFGVRGCRHVTPSTRVRGAGSREAARRRRPVTRDRAEGERATAGTGMFGAGSLQHGCSVRCEATADAVVGAAFLVALVGAVLQGDSLSGSPLFFGITPLLTGTAGLVTLVNLRRTLTQPGSGRARRTPAG